MSPHRAPPARHFAAPPGRGTAISRRRVLSLAAVAMAAPSLARAAGGLVFHHAWGTTTLPRPAARVVSLGFTTHDTLLGLGVVPLALRHWYGTSASGVWPWAEPLLQGARPDVLRGEVSMERVAAHRPDLIVAMGSGISRDEYHVLSRIAPTLMHPATSSAYATPWDEIALMLGRATGRLPEAQARVDAVRARFGAARARIGSAGRTGVAAYHWAGATGAYLPGDARAVFLAELGLTPPPAVLALARHEAFFRDLSPEDLSPLEADVLVWISSFDSAPELVALPMRRTLAAHRAGREVFAGPLVGSAMSHASLLSMPWALDALEADFAAALDGDPATPVASAVAAGLIA